MLRTILSLKALQSPTLLPKQIATIYNYWEAQLPDAGLPKFMGQFGIAQHQLIQVKAALDQLYVSFEQRLEDPVLAASRLALLKGLLLTDKEIDGKA